MNKLRLTIPRRFVFIKTAICLPGLLLVLCCGMAQAQAHRVAMITWRGETPAEKGFMDELNACPLTVAITVYHAGQDIEKLQDIITVIEKQPVDLIYVFGTTASKTVLSRIKTTPVVFNIVSRPVDSGIIAGWESSKNNATGASNKVSAVNSLKTLKKVINFKRLGIIYNPKEQNSVIQSQTVKGLQAQLGFLLKEFRISCQADIPHVLPGLEGQVDAVFMPSDSMIKSIGKNIMEQVNAYGIPSISSVGSMVPEDGVLLGFVPKYYELGRIAAQKAVRILNGAHPSDIPSSMLDHTHICVNMKTARQIHVQIPMSILVMAGQIVR